jgi:hypothetical protein
MAEINLKDLSNYNISGDDLFNDSESLMTELSDEDKSVIGGLKSIIPDFQGCTVYAAATQCITINAECR